MKMKTKIILLVLFVISVNAFSAKKVEQCSTDSYGVNNNGNTVVLKFEKGKEHNHPLFAIWLADENGKYIQTLYVSESIGRGVFQHATRKKGGWSEGEIQRPAALPYWAHQRGLKNELGTFNPTSKFPVPDAYTGATPSSSFFLRLKTEMPLQGKAKIMLELNQSWDWNEHWNNTMFIDNNQFKTSSQPALVYSVDIDINNKQAEYELKPIGHSHFSGEDGSLTTDLSTITTALKIAKRISVTIE